MNTIEQVVENYVLGAYESRPDLLREIFTGDAVMSGFFGEDYAAMPASAYINSFEGREPMKDQMPEGIEYTADILSAATFGSVAVVTIRENNYAGSVDFITNFQMVMTEDGWKITSKLFTTIQ